MVPVLRAGVRGSGMTAMRQERSDFTKGEAGVIAAETFESSPGEESADATGQVFQRLVQVEDPDNDDLTFTIDSPASAALPMTIDPKTGLIRWETTAADVASSPHSYTVHVNDGRGCIAGETFAVSVTCDGTNGAPTVTSADIEQVTKGSRSQRGQNYFGDKSF
jgi:hypothetical protein